MAVHACLHNGITEDRKYENLIYKEVRHEKTCCCFFSNMQKPVFCICQNLFFFAYVKTKVQISCPVTAQLHTCDTLGKTNREMSFSK